MVRTRSGDLVGLDGVWLTLATSFVEGAVLRPSGAQLRMLGARWAGCTRWPAGGRLGPGGPWDPEEAIPATLARLDRVAGLVPPDWQAMYARSARRCWRSGAAGRPAERWCTATPGRETRCRPAGGVILIDWECGGLGLPVLDLGYCLLDCLLDAVPAGRPGAWNVQPDEDRIAAVVAGYSTQRVLSPGEQACCCPRSGSARPTSGPSTSSRPWPKGSRDGDGRRLERLRNRLAVSGTVARLAAVISAGRETGTLRAGRSGGRRGRIAQW